MNKSELITELNELSDFTNLSEEEKHKRKVRMVEIAKILLKDHYGYWNVLDRKNKENDKESKSRNIY